MSNRKSDPGLLAARDTDHIFLCSQEFIPIKCNQHLAILCNREMVDDAVSELSSGLNPLFWLEFLVQCAPPVSMHDLVELCVDGEDSKYSNIGLGGSKKIKTTSHLTNNSVK